MKKYRVIWTEKYACSKMVEAESKEEAIDKCYDLDESDTREFEGTSDWSVIEESELNPEEA